MDPGTRISERIIWYPVYMFFCLLRCLPWPVYSALVSAAEWVIFHVFSSRLRRNAAESLQIAFGLTCAGSARERLIRRSFRSLFLGLCGMVYDAGRPERLKERFELEGQEHLDKALKQGRGAVIAVGHFGPFAWMLLRLVAQGYKLFTVARPPRSAVVRRFFEDAYRLSGMKIIFSVPGRTCIAESIQALKANGVVVTPIDQNFGGAGRVFVPFFGRPAATAPGTVFFSARSGAPVFFVYALPAHNGRFRMVISPETVLPPGEGPAAGMALLTARLEELIKKHPDQWSWMHRRWKAVPKDGEKGT